MKKVFFITVIITLGMMMLFSSCKKEEVVSEPLPTATIVGYVYADLDKTVNGIEKLINIDAKILFVLDSDDLVANVLDDYQYQNILDSTIVNRLTGSFSKTVLAAKHDDIKVDILPVEFVADLKRADGVIKTCVFQPSADYSVNIRAGEVLYKIITYNVKDTIQ
jgi:hypothetical protein